MRLCRKSSHMAEIYNEYRKRYPRGVNSIPVPDLHNPQRIPTTISKNSTLASLLERFRIGQSLISIQEAEQKTSFLAGSRLEVPEVQ
jgi:hypothetical protein